MDLAELGHLADQLDSKRADRLAADKIAAGLKSDEHALQQQLISEMEENNLFAIGGEQCIIKRKLKERAIANDWPEFYEYIRKNDAFDLLHRRITDSAVLLRREDGVEIPGISLMEYSTITYSKVPK